MATLEGVNRKNFQLNTKSWRLLSDFIFDHCGDLIQSDEREGWHSGYGKMISHETAKQIADRLEALINQGVVERFRIELSIVNMDTYLNEEIVRAFARFAKDSGGFDIY